MLVSRFALSFCILAFCFLPIAYASDDLSLDYENFTIEELQEEWARIDELKKEFSLEFEKLKDAISEIVERQNIMHKKAEELRKPKEEKSKCGKVSRKGISSTIPQKALEMSNCDKEFVKMLTGENDKFDLFLNVPDSGGRAIGLCQFNTRWHLKKTQHPDFYTAEHQINECYKAWVGGTKFYGYINKERREYASKLLIWE